MGITPGPFRTASNLGAFVTKVAFEDIYGMRDSAPGDEKKVTRTLRKILLGGYTFDFRCELNWNDDGQVTVCFVLFLVSGEWDDHLGWPFAKKATAIVTHLRDRDKDVRLPIPMTGANVTKKPIPGKSNNGNLSEKISWQQIELNGFIVKNTLYVNIEFH
ncbi:hypothetical protein MTO96_029999 [Rhipicephalus appendiculatus]